MMKLEYSKTPVSKLKYIIFFLGDMVKSRPDHNPGKSWKVELHAAH